jgi:glycosyltransferase involved in cell wall biosynthesis
MKLLIVVPCFNEEKVLCETTQRLGEVLEQLEREKKISLGKVLYVNDGSKDSTWALIEQLSAQTPYVQGIKLAHNEGHQQALWAGMEWAAAHKVDAIVSIDADLQDDTQAIPEMVDAYLNGNDIVYGVRKERTTDTWMKRNTAQMFYRLMQTFGGEVVYNHADFRLMSLRTVNALMAYPERNLFLRGLVPSLGYSSTCVYYNRSERFAGESKYPFRKMLSFALDGITSFSVRPLQCISMLGLCLVALSFIAVAYAVISFMQGVTVAGWTSLLISMWFVGGMILTAVGIIGMYIGKIYQEVKRRPRYFIEKEVGV